MAGFVRLALITPLPPGRYGPLEIEPTRVTWHGASDADVALAAVNRAIRAHAVASRDPYMSEVSRRHVGVVEIGRAVETSSPDSGGAIADAVSGHSEPFEAELRLLRALLDLDQGRDYGAALEMKAAVELLDRIIPELSSGLVARYLADPLLAARALIPIDDPAAPLPPAAPAGDHLVRVTVTLLDATGAMRAAMRGALDAAGE